MNPEAKDKQEYENNGIQLEQEFDPDKMQSI
jgi:hypothetical protein